MWQKTKTAGIQGSSDFYPDSVLNYYELLWNNKYYQHQCSHTENNKIYALINASYKPCEKAGSGIRTESSNRRG